jgi:hypothetical protein
MLLFYKGDIMNIFASFECPVKSAHYLDDKRLIKMILESAQMLSTTINLNGYVGLYRITHINHPCTIWVRTSRWNYMWLVKHFKALCEEYTARYLKIHKCEQYTQLFETKATLIPDIPSVGFPNCTTFKHINNTHEAYRMYLNEKWTNDKRPATCKVTYGQDKRSLRSRKKCVDFPKSLNNIL